MTTATHRFMLSLSRIDNIGVINSLKAAVNLLLEKYGEPDRIFRMEDEYIVIIGSEAFVIGWNCDGRMYVDQFGELL